MPHDKQEIFHKACEEYREIFAIAGIRSGKSIGGANQSIKEMLRKKSRGAFIAPTFEDARAILDFTLMEYLPSEIIIDQNKLDHYYRLSNGSVFYYKSADVPQKLRSLGDLDWIWMDEAEQFHDVVFTIARGRVFTRKGKIFITTSPQKWFGSSERKRLSWIFRFFEEEGIDLDGSTEIIKGEIAIINWSLEDNTYIIKDAESRGELEKLRRKYGALQSAQEIDGQYVDLYAGGIFHEEMFNTYDSIERFDTIIIAFDPAISKELKADYSVMQMWGAYMRKAYLIEERRGHWSYIEQRALLKELSEMYNVDKIVIEDMSYQRAIIEDLHNDGFPAIGVRPKGDKIARAKVLSGATNEERVLFAKDVLTRNFLNEFVQFPAGVHDDRVDCAGYGVDYLLTRPGGRIENIKARTSILPEKRAVFT